MEVNAEEMAMDALTFFGIHNIVSVSAAEMVRLSIAMVTLRALQHIGGIYMLII
jgi:hypothetical protein